MPLRLVRRPKSPNWIIRGTVRGIRVEESAGTSDRRVAEEIRAKREAEILTDSVYGRRATCTFAEAALSYIECGGSTRFLEAVLRHFSTTPLARIDQDAIERGARKTYPGTSNATLDRQFFTPTSAVLKHHVMRASSRQLRDNSCLRGAAMNKGSTRAALVHTTSICRHHFRAPKASYGLNASLARLV
jgi:hypothetical protein